MKAPSAIDDMVVEQGKCSIHSSSSPSNVPPVNPGIERHIDCGAICQAVHPKRRRAEHTTTSSNDVLDDDDVDISARGDDAAISIETFVHGPFDDHSGGGALSPSGAVDAVARSKGHSSTKQSSSRRSYLRSFQSSGAGTAIVVVLPFLFICAIVSTAAATEVAGESVGVPTLEGRFRRRQVTSARANLRRPSSSSTTTTSSSSSSNAEVLAPSDENTDGFFADSPETDRKLEPLEFRIENVNSLRPHQGEAPPQVAGNTQNLLAPYFPTVEQRASIVFHPPVTNAAASTKATSTSSIPSNGALSSNYFSSQPVQNTLPLQKQPQPHGGRHWHEAANFGPQIQFMSVGATIPAEKLTLHSSSSSTGTSSSLRNTYQDAQEDYQNFYKQTQEEKDETAKAREDLLAGLYGGTSLDKPNHSDDVGASSGVEGPVNRGPATAVAGFGSGKGNLPPPLQSRANDFSFILQGNTIAVVVPGEPPISTDITVDPSNNFCVTQSGCKVYYNPSTNDFVDANGAPVEVGVDIDTIISQSGSSSSNSNLGYELFLDGNTIAVRYQGKIYKTDFTVDSNNCVVGFGNCEYLWDGKGGFVNENGQAVTFEIDLETITSSGTGTANGSSTTTTETTVTEETTTETSEGGGGNDDSDDDGDGDGGDDGDDDDDDDDYDDEENSDSADEDSAEHSGGKGHSSSSGKGKGKGKGR